MSWKEFTGCSGANKLLSFEVFYNIISICSQYTEKLMREITEERTAELHLVFGASYFA